MPLQSTLAASGSEESETAAPDKHKSRRMKTGWAHPAQKIGLSDDSCRIANIAHDTNPLVPSETDAYFSGTDKDVQVINSPNSGSRDLSKIVLLKEKEASRPFGAHIVPVAGKIRVRDGHGEWHEISISGRMVANLLIKDKHCRNKRVHTVNKDMENVEFWIFVQDVETFHHGVFVNHAFAVAHKLDKPVTRALANRRTGLHKSLPEIADHDTMAAALARQRATVAAETARLERRKGR